MKTNLTNTGTELKENYSAEVSSRAATPSKTSVLNRFSAACREKYQQLKDRLANELAFEFGVDARAVRQVVNEASALAAATQFPYLLLPTLAEEKVWAASHSRAGRALAFAA